MYNFGGASKRDGVSLLRVCGIGETVPELIFGHAAKVRLADIWENNTILKELREGLPHRFEGICGDCVMKGVCLGSCVAQNYYSSRNLWAGFWYCEAAKKLRVFPVTRLQTKCEFERRLVGVMA